MSMRTPPKLACWLLRARLSKAQYESISGDLFEEFASEGRSRSWFWRQTFSALSPRFHDLNHVLNHVSNHVEPESKRWNPMTIFNGLSQDVRYAARTLRATPGFAAVSVAALALGIGVNTGIFTVLNAVALRPLPVTDAGNVVGIYQSFRGKVSRNTYGSQSYFSYPEYLEYRADNHVFSGLAAFASTNASLGGANPRRVQGQVVSCNYFTVLGRQPVLGRAFTPDECTKPDAAPVVVLSHAFWTSQFGADPRIAGSTIVLNRRAFTVIGIAPPGFTGASPTPSAFWAPVVMQGTLIPATELLSAANTSWLEMLGRLRPGVSLSRARAELAIIAGRIDGAYPGRTTTLSINAATYMGDPESRTAVLAGGTVALLAVGLVLLIACANVANLLLSRAAGRQKEIAIRLSAGASRGRLIRQLLTESLLISLTGGALGSLVAFWTFDSLFRWTMSIIPAGIPPITLNLTPDLRVLAYSIAVSATTGILFGLIPALQATRPDIVSALKDEGSGFAGARISQGLLRNALVAAQVAVCLVLMIAAGLLARGLQSAQTLDPGFSMKGVVTASFDLQQQGYDDTRALSFNRRLIERASAIPGVDAVSQADVIPLEGSSFGTVIEIQGVSGRQNTHYNEVSPAFFSLLGIPIVRGRGFTPAEAERGASVAVISEATAQRFWPGQDPLGKSFRLGPKSLPTEVIGVARDIRSADLAHLEKTFFYAPPKLELQPRMRLLAHTNGNVATASRSIREAAHALDTNLIVTVKPLEENYEFWRLPSRILASMTAALGLLGLLLASVGIYGVVSYAVSRRIREIGIRMSLGANSYGIMTMILKQAMSPVLLGVAVGFAICVPTSRLMSVMLYGISPLDPLTFAGVALFLAAIALLACYIPARRATRVDPAEALRYE
jgi:macrolide transport system ATP-binding/permease protein